MEMCQDLLGNIVKVIEDFFSYRSICTKHFFYFTEWLESQKPDYKKPKRAVEQHDVIETIESYIQTEISERFSIPQLDFENFDSDDELSFVSIPENSFEETSSTSSLDSISNCKP